MTTHKQIIEFWDWFSNYAPQLGDEFENEELLQQLDQRINSMGDFAWELGPGSNTEYAFTISPGGDRELLAETQAIVDAAPFVSGWEFYSAKPPKQWESRFEIIDADGNPFQVETSGWHSVLLKYEDGAHELVVEAQNLTPLPADYQRWAVEIALDGLLGESRRLEVIDEVTVVAKFSRKENAAAFPVIEIRERIG